MPHAHPSRTGLAPLVVATCLGLALTPLQALAQTAAPITEATASGMARADADMAAVLAALQALGAKPVETLTPAQARSQPTPADAVQRVMQARGIQPDAAVRAVRSRDITVDGAAGPLPARLYVPAGQPAGPMPMIVFWHGGGWVIADLDTYDATPRSLAARTGATVLSLHYRQAPEHPFPAAHDDAAAAYGWVTRNSESLGVDNTRLILAGESAGGNLALATAIEAKTRPDMRDPVHVLAIYPVAGSEMTTRSYREHAQAAPLSKAGMEWFVSHVFRDPSDALDPRINLVGRADFRGLPPVTIVSAEIDPLRSEGEALAAKMREAGIDVAQRTFGGATHEFFGMAGVVADADAAQRFAVERMQPAMAGTR